MATYVVGDVQGCFLTFRKLLEDIQFDDKIDKLVLLGDVINRGPHSLPMLRFLKDHQSSIEMVLGNHEIFAIALALNAIKTNRAHTLQDLLEASDKSDLINFLRSQPLLRQMDNNIFVHAGILPAITIDEAKKTANDLSHMLKSNQAQKFLARYYEKIPTLKKTKSGPKRSLRLALAYFTLLRMCETANSMDLTYSGALDKAPKNFKPWFTMRNDGNFNIFFGHWAALGFYQYQRYVCLDSGCVWGNKLTAVRLPDQKIFQIANIDKV